MSDDEKAGKPVAWFEATEGMWNWPRAIASVVMTIGFVLLVAMCAGWMPWQQ